MQEWFCTKIKAQELTPDQYYRAHKIVAAILTFAYLLFVGVEFINSKGNITTGVYARVVFYLVSTALLYLNLKVNKEKKMGMIIYAISYLIVYTLAALNNGVGILAFAFVILIGFTVYLNSRVILYGCLYSLIMCAYKTYVFKAAGNIEMYNLCNVITMGMVASLISSVRSSNLLIKFDKEHREVIEEQSKKREEVALMTSDIVNELDNEFTVVLEKLNTIVNKITESNEAMNVITASSENNVSELSTQVDMTEKIQARIEDTNNIVSSAIATTSDLKSVINNGTKLSAELHKQSEIVDANTDTISKTIELLVENVQKVSGITESILKISSQTNLLALNASIEAARAGEAGRGFSVVADQIRNLAEETKVSTEQITSIINELNSITTDTQLGLANSVESINIQRDKVVDVANSFTEIESGIGNLVVDVDKIGDAVSEIFDTNKVMTTSIESISSSSENVMEEAKNSQLTISDTSISLEEFIDTLNTARDVLDCLKEVSQT